MLIETLRQHDPAVVDLSLRTPIKFEAFKSFVSTLRLNKTIECVFLHSEFLHQLKDEDETYQLFDAIGSLPKLECLNVSFSSVSVSALSALLHQAKTLRMLHLRRVSFTGSDDDMSKLKKSLANHESLQEFHVSLMAMSGNRTINLSPIVEALAYISTIEEVYISIDGTETTEAIDALVFVQLLHSKSMQRLSLLGCKLCNEHCILLGSALESNDTLKYLQLCRTDMGHHGIEMIATSLSKNRSLETLCLANNLLEDQDCLLIADSIRINSTLETLDLHENNFGQEGSSAIFRALKGNSGLKMLDLSNNNLTDDGISSLADAMVHNESLKALYLLSCQLSKTNSITIANALQMNKSLKTLNLYGNAKVGNEVVKSFIQALRLNFSLENLEIPFKEDVNKKELCMHLRLNRLGRASLLQNNMATVEDWVMGLYSVGCDLDSIFYYLTNNPSICHIPAEGECAKRLVPDSTDDTILTRDLSLEPSKAVELQSELHLRKSHAHLISRDGVVALVNTKSQNATNPNICFRATAA